MPTVTDSPFYRVSVKALIFDDQNQLLVFLNSDGLAEMPGGGWEHGERMEECITRELLEEMNIVPETIGSVQFVYRSVNEKGYHKLCLAVPVTLKSFDFVPGEEDLIAAKFVSKDEFVSLPFQLSEKTVSTLAAKIWPPQTS